MKTLVAISDPLLIQNVFDQQTLARLCDITDVDWAPQDGSFTQTAFAAAISKYDACITSWGSPKLIGAAATAAARLKFLGHAAGTVVPYVSADVLERGVTVVSASEQLARSTAECAMALMMAGAWNFRRYQDGLQHGRWSQSRRETVMGVYGQTIGLVGLGQVSRQLIEFLRPFAARVLVCSEHCSAQQAAQLGVELTSLDDLLSQSNIVSLHSGLNPSTLHMINAGRLARLQDGALLVNTARSQLVDSAALLKELEGQRIGAALDVFDREPLAADDALLQLPNVFCTPHIGGVSGHWRKKIGAAIVAALADFIALRPVPQAITLHRLQAMSAN